MRRVLAATVMVLLTAAGTAQAQSADSGVFVSGSVMAGLERYSHGAPELVDVTITGDTDMSSSVPGGGFAVGTWLAPRVTLQLEVALLGSAHSDYTIGLPIQNIPAEYVALGLLPPTLYESRYQQAVRTTSFSVLAGYHPSTSRRVRGGFLAGMAILRERAELTLTTTTPAFPPLLEPTSTTSTSSSVSYPKAAVLGADGEIRATSRLSVIPQVRVLAFSSDVSIRPGVSVRWTF